MPAIVAASIGLIGLSQASDVWERAWATHIDTVLSPDACLRLDAFEPFWVLPSFFQRAPEADSRALGHYGMVWQSPRFYRLFEASSGRLLGESPIFELVDSGEPAWSPWRHGEHREVSVAGYVVGVTKHCTDDVARASIERHYMQKAVQYRAIMRMKEPERLDK